MKIFIAAMAFAVTLGGIFLFEKYKIPTKEDGYAQLIQQLPNQQATQASTSKTANLKTKSDKKPGATAIFFPTPKTLSPSFPTSSTPSTAGTPPQTPTPTITPIATPILSPTPSPTPTPSQIAQSLPSHTPEPTHQNEQTQDKEINIISITSPIKRGNNANLKIQTIPTAECLIKVTLPSGSISGARGLQGTKTSDGNGYIIWEWRLGGSTKAGTSKIEVTCTKDGVNLSKTIQMGITE